MSNTSIVRGGAEAFQLPTPMIYCPMSEPLDGRTYRVLFWILWDAHKRGLWPGPDDDPVDRHERYSGIDLLDGAGLQSDNGYKGLRAALQKLSGVYFIDDESGGAPGEHLPILLEERPGPHFDLLLPRALAATHWTPLSRYALLNMDHIRGLREPLDFAIYARACHVARARHPQFEIDIDEIAAIGGFAQASWASLRRPFVGACERVARRVGARLLIQGWCSGHYAGIDRLLVRVGTPGNKIDARFRPQPSSKVFEVDDKGWRPLSNPPP